MIRHLIFLFALLGTIFLNAQTDSRSTKQFLEEIDQKIPQLLHGFSIPGAALAIIEDGEIALLKGYGFSDLEQKIKVTETTGFNIGSISKTVTAWGVMKLVNEGKLDLDAPVENYLTRWHFPASKFNADSVTIRRLLSHTAGLSLHSVSAGPPYDTLPTLEDWLIGKNNGLGRVEIIMEPGTRYQYSGGGFGVLQLIIEEVSGQTFEDYMQAQVLNPLGMTNSSFKIDDNIMAASATPYDQYGEITDFGRYTVQAGAGMHTTLRDFTRFAMASLYKHSNNPVLPPDRIRQMMVPVKGTRGIWAWGLGYQTVHMGPSQVFSGHGGSNEGWQANFHVDPESNDGFIVFTNGTAGYTICNLVFCEWITWKSGKSPWEECYPKLSVANQLKKIIDDEGIEEISTHYQTIKKEKPEDYDFSEGQLNELGYYYMGKGDLAKASAVFRLNTEAFPNAYNVYDSYGEALLAQGDRLKAIKNYTKSLELNPGNGNAVDVLEELGITKEDLIGQLSVNVDSRVLAGYAGRYQTSTGEIVTIQTEGGNLTAEIQQQKFKLVAQSTARFIALGEGAIFSFFTAATGQKGLWARERIWRKLPNASHQNPAQRLTGNFLVLRNKSSWGRATDFENVLGEIGCTYVLRESGALPELDLSVYDAIIIPGAQDSIFYSGYVHNIERFNKYVARGGTLVLELNGAEKNKSFLLPKGVTILPSKAFENTILDADHPIFFPFVGKRILRARYASMGYFQDVPEDALLLAVEAEGSDTFTDQPTFIEYAYGEGRVIAGLQCFHDRDGSGRGPLMESIISYALTKAWTTED